MFAQVKARIMDQVPELNLRVEGAAQFAKLLKDRALPDAAVFAHLLPLAIQGSRGDAASGMFTQNFSEGVGVLLTFKADGGVETDDLDSVRDLVMRVARALAGWAPNDQIGVFEVRRGQLMSVHAGAIVYQLDFAISDQLRIAP